MANKCGWASCTALPVEGREYCVVHQPDRLIERLKNILTDRVFRLAAPLPIKYQRMLVNLERQILNDLESTT